MVQVTRDTLLLNMFIYMYLYIYLHFRAEHGRQRLDDIGWPPIARP